MAAAKRPRKKRAAPSAADELRRQAEELLDKLSADAADAASPVPEDVAAVIHDLRVHQIELEMQNETLRETLAQLEESRQMYVDLYDTIPVGHVTVDDIGLILRANLPLADMLGTVRDSLVGRPLSAVINKEDQDAYYLLRRRLSATGRPQEAVFRLVRADGGALWVQARAVPTRAGGAASQACEIALGDLTARMEAEDETRRLNDSLEKRVADRTAELRTSVEELESFTYSVAHDLRTPLRALDGFSQMLLQDYGDRLDEKARSHLEHIRAADQNMGILIDGLLEITRLNRRELSRRRIDLGALAREVVDELRAAEPGRQVELVVADDLSANADFELSRTLLANLIGNAWKFTAKHATARIEVGFDEADDKRAFYVRDDGAGFDMAYADKLFGAFHHLHIPGEFEGAGIGLATAQRIVARHGGRIWAAGAVEKGATFWFTLPDGDEPTGVETARVDRAGDR